MNIYKDGKVTKTLHNQEAETKISNVFCAIAQFISQSQASYICTMQK